MYVFSQTQFTCFDLLHGKTKGFFVTRQGFLILSLFSGIGLLDRAFREAGFVVVSAGDLVTGQDIRDFRGIAGRFDGIIGGSPCQAFSDANRDRPADDNHYGYQMIEEYKRVVFECDPTWYLFENVRNAPNVIIDGYDHQRIDINQGWFDDVYRLRHIQFGHKQGKKIFWPRGVTRPGLKSAALASDDRSFRELCRLQGLEDDFDLPDFTVRGKKKVVGNGVPIVMGRVIANAVRDVAGLEICDSSIANNCDFPGRTYCDSTSFDNGDLAADKKCDNELRFFSGTSRQKCDSPAIQNYCACGCGRSVTGRRKTYDSACRKRLSRKKAQYEK
ncbi:DNA cytosine methyltransferase [Sulfuricurvum sp. IAE1]|uniref:DNA cytosine methyltransferase n=1 Tax=Sulfuricurvum sp. IAE1 TaxID=2546102 RepID=UPI001404903B|nr:DNA cytosine methyltransferase [Sulfuricurvum sp. IAE1]